MNKSELLIEINYVLNYFKGSSLRMDSTICKKYSELEESLVLNDLKNNPIKGSVRAYLDAHNDWDNPILLIMGDLEDKIDCILNNQ